MFLIIPLSLIAVSAAGILVIILRKREYLNKLHTLNIAGEGNDLSLSGNFNWSEYLDEFFPELRMVAEKMGVEKHKALWLTEAEKLLRKMRVIFLRVDRMSDAMIKNIRRVNKNNKLITEIKKEEVAEPVVLNKPAEISYSNVESPATISHAFLKNEEERLIIEIAKNPKDAKLYESLGDLYMEMGNYTDAKESFEAAVELNSQGESLKEKLSSALLKLNSAN